LDAAAINVLTAARGANVARIVTAIDDVIDVTDAVNWRMIDPVIRDGSFLLVAENAVAGEAMIEADVPRPWHNFLRAGDVNNNGTVTASDALRIINELGRHEYFDQANQRLLDPLQVASWPGLYFDHNGDNRITALDALRVINDLLRQRVNGGEAEQVVATQGGALIAADSVAANQAGFELFASPSPPVDSTNPQRQVVADFACQKSGIESDAPAVDWLDARPQRELTVAVDQLLADESFVSLLGQPVK